MQCYCGSTKLFDLCCEPYLTGEQKPETAELLMRSRFSAYAIKNAQYILDTYASKSKQTQSLKDIQSWANDCIWLALNIHSSDETTVEFSAYYVNDNRLCHLREVSRFTKEPSNTMNLLTEPNKKIDHTINNWVYLDGDIITNEEIKKVKRNDLCPCNQYPTRWAIAQNKKYKQCCAK